VGLPAFLLDWLFPENEDCVGNAASNSWEKEHNETNENKIKKINNRIINLLERSKNIEANIPFLKTKEKEFIIKIILLASTTLILVSMDQNLQTKS